MRKATFTWPITLTGEENCVILKPVLAISEATRRAKSPAISYLSIFRHLHNKKYEEKSLFSAWMFERRAPCVMNELTCEKAG